MLVLALVIVWMFWLALIGLMVFWRRSWVPLFMFPFVVSGLLCLVGAWSAALAFWLSAAVHGMALVLLVSVALLGKHSGDDPLFSRPPRQH